MNSTRLDFYFLFFEPSEWVSEESLRNVNPGILTLWVIAAASSQAVAEMVVARGSSSYPLAWMAAGSLLRFFACMIFAFGFCAFVSAVSFWESAPRVESRSIFRLALLAYLPAILSAPLALVSFYFDAWWTVWLPGRVLIWIWSLALLYKGLRVAIGLPAIWSALILLISLIFVAVSACLELIWIFYQLLLQF